MYKSQLQEYAQKAGWTQPVYNCEREGSAHEPNFKATVTVQGVIYESPPGFRNLKLAEHAAAQVALEATTKASDGVKNSVASPIDSGLCKNLLQEYAQKNGFSLPVYRFEKSGELHSPSFIATIEVGGVFYKGGASKNKREAEIKAAKTALLAIHAASRTGSATSSDSRDSTTQPHSGQKRGRGSVSTTRMKNENRKRKWHKKGGSTTET